jgi:WD40 repeat protein
MSAIRVSFIFLFCLTKVYAQQKSESIGSPDVIVLDLEIDEAKDYLAASTITEVQLWNYKSKTLVRTWAAKSIHAIELNQNFLAGISKSGELFIWDIESGKERTHVIGSSPLLSLAWIDSIHVAIGDAEGVLYKINSVTGEIDNRAKLNASITALSRCSNNTLLIGKQKHGLEIYDALALKPMKSVEWNKGSISIIHFTDSAKYFVTVSDEKKLTKWRVSDLWESIDKYLGTWITSVDYNNSKMNSIVATGKLNGDIIVKMGFGKYTAKTNAIVNKIVILENELPSIKLVVATHGGGIQMWDAKKMKLKN